MSENDAIPQLQMIWPAHLLDTPPAVELAPGYTIRTYRPGDEDRFYALMDLAGWPGWDAERLHIPLNRILPDGWFMAIHQRSNEIVATAMSIHNGKGRYPFQGVLGWVAGDPAHAGQGLGKSVVAAATARLIRVGYRDISLYTEDFRLSALKIYLSFGYVPLLYTPDMPARWQTICKKVGHLFTPEPWMAAKAAWEAIRRDAGGDAGQAYH